MLGGSALVVVSERHNHLPWRAERPLHLLAEWTRRKQSMVLHVRGLIPVPIGC